MPYFDTVKIFYGGMINVVGNGVVIIRPCCQKHRVVESGQLEMFRQIMRGERRESGHADESSNSLTVDDRLFSIDDI